MKYNSRSMVMIHVCRNCTVHGQMFAALFFGLFRGHKRPKINLFSFNIQKKTSALRSSIYVQATMADKQKCTRIGSHLWLLSPYISYALCYTNINS